MMSDCYEWFDPFEQRESARRAWREAAYAREQGQNRVLRMLVGDRKRDFNRAIDRAAYGLAELVAKEFLQPHLLRHRIEYDEYKRRLELEISANLAVLSPAVNYATSGELDARMVQNINRDESSVVVTYHTSRPFQYHVKMSPMDMGLL